MPATARKPYTDHQMEAAIGLMLRIGVSVSAAIVLLGGLLSLRHPDAAIPDYSHFQPEKASLRSITDVLAGAAQLQGTSIIQLGILLLIATPVVRVIFCIVGFALQKDRIYIVISSLVLLILLYSLFQAGAL